MTQETALPVTSGGERFNAFWQQYGAYMAFVPAVVAMLGSLYFSEVAGFVPCTLCWYQRILMYPLSLIILVGILKRDEYLPQYVLPFAIIGGVVSLYHYMLQWGVFSKSAACATGVPCSVRYINWGGFVTIPFLALSAFVIITGVMVVTRRANLRLEE